MGNIGDPMTSGTIPVVGTVGTGYAATINTFLAEVKQRLEAKIPLGSFLPGLLDMLNNAIANLSYISLYPAAVSPTTPVGSLQAFGGNLFWVSPSGAVQITNGASLNSGALGGITGDYGGANPAQFRFVDADTEYYAYDDFGGGKWAYLWTRGVDIAGGLTSANKVRLQSTVTASYSLTLPNAPASQVLTQVDNTGAVTYTNTLANNANLTLQGTGMVKHGDYNLTQSGIYGFASSGGTFTTVLVGNSIYGRLSAGAVGKFPIVGLKTGSRIKSIKIAGAVSGTDPTILAVVAQEGATSGTKAFTTSGAFTTTGLVATITTPYTLVADDFVYLSVQGGSGNTDIGCISVTYDTP